MRYFLDALAYLSDPAHWSGPGGLGARTVEHLWVTALVVVIAGIIAVPVGIALGHVGRGAGFVSAIAGGARAIPTLGLLTLVGLGVGIGLGAPLVALVVLAIPSLLAGAYSGVAAVNPTVVDAARAQGMTEGQIVSRVELPLASPVLIGGLRVAALQVVSTATLAAYVADVGLGRPLFAALKTNTYSVMLAAALLVIALALILELLLAALQRFAHTRAVGQRTARHPTRKG